MRLRAAFFAMVALAGTAAAAWQIGTAATAEVERRTAGDLRATLAQAGQDWAEIAVDGLIVTLAGAAPDEGAHLRAVEVVHQRVGMRRLEDRTSLLPAEPPAPPAFGLELLRNLEAVSLIGLAPRHRHPRPH